MTRQPAKPDCEHCGGLGWVGGGRGFSSRRSLGSAGAGIPCVCVLPMQDEETVRVSSDESLPAQTLVEELKSLRKLHQAGALTDSEFSRAKAQLLGETAIQRPQSPDVQHQDRRSLKLPQVNLQLVPGDRIVHPVFGEGEVLAVQGEGEKAEATVRFDARGIKVLAVAWAPIVRVE